MEKKKCFSGGNYSAVLWTFHPITVSGQTTVIYRNEIGEEMGKFLALLGINAKLTWENNSNRKHIFLLAVSTGALVL